MLLRDLILGFAAPVVLLALAFILHRRKLYFEFPFFFLYTLYAAGAGILREVLPHRGSMHFVFYWVTEALFAIAALLVLREVLGRLFPIEDSSHRWFRWLLPVVVLAILGFTFLETTYHPLGHGGISSFVRGLYWFDVGVHALEGIVLVLVVALTQLFSLSWRKCEFGILTGFGISAFVTMFADLFRFELGSGYETFFRYGPPIAYIVAVLVWLDAFFRRPGPDHRNPQMGPDEMLGEVRRAREGLKGVKRVLGLRCGISNVTF